MCSSRLLVNGMLLSHFLRLLYCCYYCFTALLLYCCYYALLSSPRQRHAPLSLSATAFLSCLFFRKKMLLFVPFPSLFYSCFTAATTAFVQLLLHSCCCFPAALLLHECFLLLLLLLYCCFTAALLLYECLLLCCCLRMRQAFRRLAQRARRLTSSPIVAAVKQK